MGSTRLWRVGFGVAPKPSYGLNDVSGATPNTARGTRCAPSDHATSEIASGSKLGIDATKKISGEGCKRPWPPLIQMDAAVKAKVEELFRADNPVGQA